ncbi:hypothetical protein ACP70R_049019 [Stipagrostis hirtigluma subsp. patula]
MYTVENKGGAIALLLVSVVAGGSFFPMMLYMERRGRLPQHIYLDYFIANFLVAVLIAVTVDRLERARLGTTVNYFLDARMNRADILFPGVACFVVAFFFGAGVHCSNVKDKEDKIRTSGGNFSSSDGTNIDIEISGAITDEAPRSNNHNASNEAKPGTAEFILQVKKRRSIKVSGSRKFLGLGLVFFTGTRFFIASPAFNLATNDQWHMLKKGVPHLVVYTAFFYFNVVGFVFAVCVNIWFLYRPIAGVPASTIGAYVKDWNGRHWALLSGLLCGICNGFRFMGGQAAGIATANAVMASPLISTFWDIVLFGEYRRSSRKTYFFLASMLAIGVLLASAGHRKNT